MPRSLIACLFIGLLPTAARADWLGLEFPLTNAQQVRNLVFTPSKIGGRVKLTGVVTHVNRDTNELWIQDGAAGVFVTPNQDTSTLAVGDLVEIAGRTEEGSFAPCVVAQQVKKLGQGKLPNPVPSNLTIEESRWQDGLWVEAYVVVRGTWIKSGTTYVEALTARGRGTIVLPGDGWKDAAVALRGSAVVVRGVCVATAQKQLVSNTPKLVASALPEVPAAGVPDLDDERPLRVIDQLLGFSPRPHPGGWPTKIAGVVTAIPVPGAVIVQDATGPATIWTEQPRTEVSVGEQVEVVGLLRIDDHHVALTRARIKSLGIGKQPAPVPVQVVELANRSRHALLVKLEGRIEAVRAAGSSTAVTLVADELRFEALVAGVPDQNERAKFEIGSRVAVTGVSFDTDPSGKPAATPVLFVAGADAVTVLEAAPPSRAAQSLATPPRNNYLIAGLLALVAAGGVGLWVLWGRVRRVTAAVAGHAGEKGQLEKQLQEATKLESVGRLAGGIAHDFNNLLTVINGCAEMLADETGQGGRAAELTDDIRRAGERAAALTRQLLTFSRRRDLNIRAVDLNSVVLDTTRLLDRVIREDIEIETNLEPGLPAVRGDASLLQQIIMNLAVNARDAMPRGGKITLRTTLVFDADAALGSLPRRYVRLTVSDTGVGMTDEVKARLFEPFFTTKEDGKGTGLGLATVYRVIQSLSGHIQLESVVGGGTTFQIDLRIHGDPVSEADLLLPAGEKSQLGPAAPAQQLTGTTVLVVEDNEMVRNLLWVALTSDGATVLDASTPARALELAGQLHERIDVMLTDVVMPGMSGRELAEHVCRERPDLRVVYMSGHGAEEIHRTGLHEEEVEFLQKPFTPDSLTSRILRVLGKTAA